LRFSRCVEHDSLALQHGSTNDSGEPQPRNTRATPIDVLCDRHSRRRSLGEHWGAYSRLGWSYNELTAKAQGFGGPFSVTEYEEGISWAIGSGYNLTERCTLRCDLARSTWKAATPSFFHSA